MPTYLTRNTAAVAVVVVSAKRDVVANNMKLTKEKLQQIIKEELENLVNEEAVSDYDRAKEWMKGVERMMSKSGKSINREMRERLHGVLADGGAKDDKGMIGPLSMSDVRQLDMEARRELAAEEPTPKSTVSPEDSLRSQAAAYERDPDRFTRGT